MTLEEYLLQTAPVAIPLHVVHCVSAGRAMAKLSELTLRPEECDVYETELLYLFYGRPAYKAPGGAGASGILDLAPVCLVLDPEIAGLATRVVPFDSGGFPRYSHLIGPDLPRFEFELGDPGMVRRLVSAFWSTNRNYYDQEPTVREQEIPPSRRSARAIARLLADASIRDHDDRAGTIELQVGGEVPLADSLRAVVAPPLVLDDPEVRQALAACPGAVPLPYKTYGRFEPLAFANTIYERVDTFMEQAKRFG